MIHWMLAQLEKNPAATFYEKDLIARFPEGFEQAKAEHILKRLPHPLSKETYVTYHRGLPRSHVVIPRDDGVLEAFDPEDPEAEPIELSPSDLIQWTVDRDRLALKFQKTNSLAGQPQALDHRMHFLGTKLTHGLRIAVVLGLFSSEAIGLRHTRGLANLLPDSYDRYLVVCPTYTPTLAVARDIAAFRTVIVSLNKDDLWKINIPETTKPSVQGRRVVLTDVEEEEFIRHGFHVRLPIHVTASGEGRNSTVVTLDGNAVSVPQAEFRLFMLLVTALFQYENGYLPWNDIKFSQDEMGELSIAPDGLEQAISRLRTRFKSPLGGLKGSEFIERKNFRIRISTHRRFVTYDREGLFDHPDSLVRQWAQRLPDDPRYVLSV